jgi:hypothetical protein
MIRLNIIQKLIFTIPNLLFILSLISLLSLILITGSTFKNYLMFFEYNDNFLLITSIYAQDNGDIFGDDYIFPPFEEENVGIFGDDYIFPPFREGGVM